MGLHAADSPQTSLSRKAAPRSTGSPEARPAGGLRAGQPSPVKGSTVNEKALLGTTGAGVRAGSTTSRRPPRTGGVVPSPLQRTRPPRSKALALFNRTRLLTDYVRTVADRDDEVRALAPYLRQSLGLLREGKLDDAERILNSITRVCVADARVRRAIPTRSELAAPAVGTPVSRPALSFARSGAILKPSSDAAIPIQGGPVTRPPISNGGVLDEKARAVVSRAQALAKLLSAAPLTPEDLHGLVTSFQQAVHLLREQKFAEADGMLDSISVRLGQGGKP